MDKNSFNTIIIGGGAAGLMCAATIVNRGNGEILLLEKMEKCGRKVRITGKGRCNITNNKSREDFLSRVHGGRDFVTHAFDTFDNMATMRYFESIGLPLSIEQGGRVYPKSGDAWDVVRALENRAKREGVKIWCDSEVTDIIYNSDSTFTVEVKKNGDKRLINAKKVVVATGGVSYPSTGSTGDGYRFAHNNGHTVVPVMPALVPFEVDRPFSGDMKGLLLKNVTLSLVVDGVVQAKESGEIEFFAFGIGGGAVYRVSRQAVEALYSDKRVELSIDLKPALSRAKIVGRIERELQSDGRLTVGALLRKLLPQKIIASVLKETKLSSSVTVSKLNSAQIDTIIYNLKNYSLPVVADRGFKEAVITVGGVSTEEVNNLTMESLILPNLYFIGELLDIDADTGGYNLQLAFSTAYLAAQNV